VSNPIRKALPWASAAGAGVFAAALIAGQVGAGAAITHQGVAPVVNPLGIATAVHPVSAGSSNAAGVARTSKSAKAAKAVKAAKPGTPAAGAKKSDYKFFDTAYIQNMRAASIEPAADIPHPLVPGIGYSAVNLEKDIGGDKGSCEIYGAGMYLTDIVQEGVLENSGPPDAGNKGGGIFNPTESKDTAPNLSAGQNLNARHPQVRDLTDGHGISDIPANGNGLNWQAKCDDDLGGKGIAYNTDVAGAQAIGSDTTGHLNKETGEYLGESRAFVVGLATPNGTIDFISSIMKVKALPGQEPVIDYAINATGGTIIAGSGVKQSDLTKSFNDAMASAGAPLQALGAFGLVVMGPETTLSENGGRKILNAPFLDFTTGSNLREGTAGQAEHIRLVNIDYEGQYN
jgi:hypothetical protein